jgi:PadR family transcriptional regulator, regulatory protein PadR
MCDKSNCRCGQNVLQECGCHSQRTSKFLMPAVLILLAKGPSYGYQLKGNLKRYSLQEGVPDQAAIYRLLRQLESSGTVKSHWNTESSGPARRSYQITAKGQKLLAAWAKEIEQRREQLGRLLAAYREVTISPSRKAAVRKT